ncbi:MAG: 16S rRNA processing protein RimM [Gemmatimonadetes bacterium]|nr:MAG: 16S rRNA processing protein RimM [Gemmatimonadota bacterium]
MQEELFLIGRITKPHGIRGEVRVFPETDFPERFYDLETVFLCHPYNAETTSLQVVSARPHGTFWILKFAGVESRNEAELLRNWTLEIPQHQLVELPEDTYYIFELIGLEVLTDTGQLLGRVTDVLQYGSSDIYVVQDHQREYLIPAIRDVVKQIDLSQKRMSIHLIEGLIS